MNEQALNQSPQSGWNTTKRWVVAIIGLIIVGGVVAYFIHQRTPNTASTASTTPAVVQLAPVRDLNATSTFSTVGTVTAVSEAHIQAEVGGQITSVPVQLGQQVTAGTVIARLENSAQEAALLQAKGAYDAALAGAQISNVSTADAQTGVQSALNGAVTAYKNAYTTVSGIVYGDIDVFYSDPNAQIPSVRFPAAKTAYLNNERVALRTVLPTWQQKTTSDISTDTIDTDLTEALADARQVAALLNTLITETKNAKQDVTLNGKSLNAYTPGLLADQAKLNATIASLQGAQTALQNAQLGVTKAKINATSSTQSVARAQLLQARGALRAAQARYDKTIIRSPISGSVNALYAKAGSFANPGTPVALIANNNGLEVDTSVTEADSVNVSIGDEVKINDTATGTIIAKADALDPTTGKVSVKISLAPADTIVNGSTVRVTFTAHPPMNTKSATYAVPLTALKMGVQNAAVFTLSSSSQLVAHTVTLGQVVGDAVMVTAGITPDMHIVTDARGLKEGEAVTVKQ